MILDTNALCAFVDGEAAIAEALRESSRVAIPVIVLGEFRYGVAQSRHRAAYEAWLDAHLASFDVLAVTEETAIPYAALRVALRRAGQPIPANGRRRSKATSKSLRLAIIATISNVWNG